MMGRKTRTALAAAVLLLCFAGAALGEGAREIARHGAWVVMAGESDGQRTCFATTQPRTRVPTGMARDQTYVYISAWPKDGIKAEFSVATGTAVRPGSKVMVIVGEYRYALFTANERAYVADPTAELKLIDAMKKGSSMVIESIDDSGRLVSDIYSLVGLAQTLAAITKGCG